VTPRRRRILVVGAGSLGTLYGARLARVADVQLLARRDHAEAIQRQGGAEVVDETGTTLAPVRADWRPQRLTPADTAIVLTKAHDSAAALESVAHLRGGLELVVSLQNGVEKDRLLIDWCGPGPVVGGSSMVGATLESPGRVRHTLPGQTYIGELPEGLTPRVRALAALLDRSGLPTTPTDRICSVEWSKLVHAAPTMTLTALTRMPFDRVLVHETLSAIYVRLLREGAAVAAAAGVQLDDWPGMFPVRTIAEAPVGEARDLVRERGRQMSRQGSTAVRISMLEDVRRGRRLELDAVHGFLVAEARRRDVPAPLSNLSLELLRSLERSGVEASA
jgi:2-dehydropantoate 2-reductase